jgi:outer membrane protein OmpA-like peptidoglycan-associated protein
MFRRIVIAGLASLMLIPVGAQAQQMPSATTIQRQLEAAPKIRVRPEQRVTIDQLRRRDDIRQRAPSIDIQSINFAFGSSEIPNSQMGKVETIAQALRQMSRRGRNAVVLIEGHTDAIGSFASNQILSEARAASLRRVLVREFGVAPRMLVTEGYGEEFLLVNTQQENWRNRRVTLRRVDDFLRP